MRSAFDPNEPSLQVRLNNQKILKAYLASRPFGGGIGHAGDKAQRFLPNAFLSHVATDSWYVLIWAELGIVGLLFHLFVLFYVIGKASYKVMFTIRDPITKLKMSALIAGMAGIMAASYGNAVLGQMPTALLIYATMAIISNPEIFEADQQKEELELSPAQNV
jgi:cell division protein FtsW (lipid II flippase)